MLVSVAGAPIHVVERGPREAPPVLLLHGNPDSADLWDGVVDVLAEHRRCLAPDLPGFARSGVPTAFDPSLEGQTWFVGHLLDALGIEEPIDLVGHDFGGVFGLAWATTYPERVRRLVVGSCPFHSDYRWHAWARVWRTPGLGEASLLGMNRWLFRREMRRGSPTLSDAHIARAYDHVSPASKRMVLRLYRAADPAAFAPRERALLRLTARAPTLVLWGADDPYVPAQYAHRFGTDRVHVFPDCGHWWPAEETAASASMIASFLE